MKKVSDSSNLAIIGAPQAGKTVLAVGLYATSTEEFTVSPVGEATSDYLKPRKVALEEGYWPAGSNEGDNIDLRLKLSTKGEEQVIVFREYMGERMVKDPNYLRAVIGTPKAAMILFNPSMEGLKSAEGRNTMIDSLKKVIDHLKVNKCIAVAFVVTAADRLASDLAAFREEFEGYVSEVTNYLGTGSTPLNWKRFDVTVSGELADQAKPKLAIGKNNTTHEPFLWLLERIKGDRVKKLVRKITTWAACTALCALATWGVLWVRSKSKLSDIEDKISRIETLLADAWKAKKEADVNMQLGKLWMCATNALPNVLLIGPSNPERATQLAQRLTDDIDLWGVRSLRLEYDSIKQASESAPHTLQNGWAKEFDDRLKVANPSETNAVSELDVLRKTWSTNRIPMETKWQVAKLNKDVDEKVLALRKADGETIPIQLSAGYKVIKDISQTYPLVENVAVSSATAMLGVARTNALARYCAWIAKWSPHDEKRPFTSDDLRRQLEKSLSGKITPDEFRATETNLLAQLAKAQAEWDKYQFPTRTQKHIDALKSGKDPVSALKGSLSFLGSMTNDFQTIRLGEILLKQDAINYARKEAIKVYTELIAGRWDVTGEQPLVFGCEKDLEQVQTGGVMTEQEACAFRQDLQSRFKEAKRQWDDRQKKLVKDKVKSFDNIESVLTILDAYGEFIDEHPKSPYLETLLDKVDSRLSSFLDQYVTDYERDFQGDKRIASEQYPFARMEKAGRSFYEFRMACVKFGERGSLAQSPLLKRVSGKFARLCCNRGKLDDLENIRFENAFPQTLRIKKVEVKFEPTSLDRDCRCLELGLHLESKRWDSKSRKWETIFAPALFSRKELVRGDFGASWKLFWPIKEEDGLDVLMNPFIANKFILKYKERMTDKTSSDQDGSFWWWGLDSKSNNEQTAWCNIYLPHWGLDKDNAGRLSVRITCEWIGEDFRSLQEKARQ